MRDALNLKMLPLVEENINDIDLNPMMRFISTNGYYGYHNPPHIHQKAPDVNPGDTSMNTDDQCSNEKHFEEKMEINVSRLVCRKRAWEYGHSQGLPDFKKRREDTGNTNDISSTHSQSSEPSKDIHLLEELLRETHGSNSYHWNCEDL